MPLVLNRLADRRGKFLNDLLRAILRAIFCHDDFPIGIILFRDRVQCELEVFLRPIRRDADADQGSVHERRK